MKIITATNSFRKRYGQFTGTLIWISLLKEKLHKKGEIFSITIPDAPHPIFLRAHTSDVETFCQIFIRQELSHIKKISPTYAIDAGANIGLASIYISNVHPNVIIDAIEVAPENIPVLRMNLAQYNNVSIIEKGLWNKETYLSITNPSAQPYAFQVSETKENTPGSIPATSVDKIISKRGLSSIDLFKIDIEGSELELFQEGFHNWLPKTKTIMIELHDHFKPGCLKSLNSALHSFDAQYSYSKEGEYHIYSQSSSMPSNSEHP